MTKFWFAEPSQLVRSKKLLPSGSCSPEEQWNSITRLVCVVFLILIVTTTLTNAVGFFLISLSLIIILYYLQRKMSRNDVIERFAIPQGVHPRVFTQVLYDQVVNKRPSTAGILLNQASTFRWASSTPLQPNNPSYVSNNQKILGKANPNTGYAPITVPPIVDLNYWRSNSTAEYPQINTMTYVEKGLSGYEESPETRRLARPAPPKTLQDQAVERQAAEEAAKKMLQDAASKTTVANGTPVDVAPPANAVANGTPVDVAPPANAVANGTPVDEVSPEMFELRQYTKQPFPSDKPNGSKSYTRYQKIDVPSDILNDPFNPEPRLHDTYKIPEYAVRPRSTRNDDPCAKLEIATPSVQCCRSDQPAQPVHTRPHFKLTADSQVFTPSKGFRRMERESLRPDVGRSTSVLHSLGAENAQKEANDIYHDAVLSSRESIMASLMKKNNQIAEQVKQFPRMQMSQNKFA